MKLTLERDTLISGLDRAGRVIVKRSTIPILGNMKVAARKGGVDLVGSDLDMEAVTTIAGEIEAAGETTFPFETIAGFVRKLPSGPRVSLEVSGDRLTVKSGRSRITVPTLPSADFPELSAGEFSHTLEVEASALLAMLDRVTFAISTEETRYYLCGIYLHVADVDGKAQLRAVATDGHRLARHQVEAPAGAAGLPGIIVPRKAVVELARLLKPLGEEKVALSVSATKLRLSAGVTTFTSKLVDGTYPDYERVIPQANDRIAHLSAEDLSAAVERVSAVSSEKGRAVRFTFDQGQVQLAVSNPDMGEAADMVDADYTAAPLVIGFNGRYVADILGACPAKKIAMACADAGSPCLITAEGAPGSLFVLMPMRV